MPNNLESKIYNNLPDLLSTVKNWKENGANIVFTNGVFDIVHRGHIDYLYNASKKGDKLILGLNSDSSVKRLGKGEDRPINMEMDRAFLLAAFSFIDAVIIFGDDTPHALIKEIKPDTLVKGGDYDPEAKKGDKKYIVGSDILKEYNGKVEVLSFLPGYSSTNIINKIKNSEH